MVSHKKLLYLRQITSTVFTTVILSSFQPLLFAGLNTDASLVAVERPWVSLMESLPPTLQRKKYAT